MLRTDYWHVWSGNLDTSLRSYWSYAFDSYYSLLSQYNIYTAQSHLIHFWYNYIYCSRTILALARRIRQHHNMSCFNIKTCARPNILALRPYRCAREWVASPTLTHSGSRSMAIHVFVPNPLTPIMKWLQGWWQEYSLGCQRKRLGAFYPRCWRQSRFWCYHPGYEPLKTQPLPRSSPE